MFGSLTKTGLTRKLVETKFKRFVAKLKKKDQSVTPADVTRFIEDLPEERLYCDKRVVFRNLCSIIQ